MEWTKQTIPDYDSERVTVDRIYDNSDGRHLWHRQVIKIDDQIVTETVVYEDDNSMQCADFPNSKDQFLKWVLTLKDE